MARLVKVSVRFQLFESARTSWSGWCSVGSAWIARRTALSHAATPTAINAQATSSSARSAAKRQTGNLLSLSIAYSCRKLVALFVHKHKVLNNYGRIKRDWSRWDQSASISERRALTLTPKKPEQTRWEPHLRMYCFLQRSHVLLYRLLR